MCVALPHGIICTLHFVLCTLYFVLCTLYFVICFDKNTTVFLSHYPGTAIIFNGSWISGHPGGTHDLTLFIPKFNVQGSSPEREWDQNLEF